MRLDKATKKRIFNSVDNKPSFYIFGYANIALLRHDANIDPSIKDWQIQRYLDKLLT